MKGKRFWEFRGEAGGESAELLLEGPIAMERWWGDEVLPKEFYQELTALGGVKAIRVLINSYGGEVFAGAAIHNMLKNHPARVTTYVNGIAASAASVVAMAGDEVVMPRTAMMMIHNPATGAYGDHRLHRDVADLIEKVRDTVVPVYEAKTGMDRSELLKLMDDEKWMTASEALDLGFIDMIDEQTLVSASMREGLVVVNGVGFEPGIFKTIPAAFLAGAEREVKPDMNKANGGVVETPPQPSPKGEGEGEPIVNSCGCCGSTNCPGMGDGCLTCDMNPANGDMAPHGACGSTCCAGMGDGCVDCDKNPANGMGAKMSAERGRVSAIRKLARPGAEQIIEDALGSDAQPADVALKILTSEDVRNAKLLAQRRGDSPHVPVGGAGEQPEGERKVGLLMRALRMARGEKPEGGA